MKRFGIKILSSLVLCLTLVYSGVSTSLQGYNTVSASAKISSSASELFSSFEKVKSEDVINYAFVDEELKKETDLFVMLASGYSYLIIYEKPEGTFIADYSEITISSAKDIKDDMFTSLSKDDKYHQRYMKYAKGTAHLLMRKDEPNSPILYIGAFSSVDDLPVRDIEPNIEPQVVASITEQTKDYAKINAIFSLDSSFTETMEYLAHIDRVELWSEDSILDSVYIEDENQNSVDFIVKSNGEYYIKVYTSISEGKSEKLTVSKISTKTPEEEESDKLKSDDKAPVVTFSKLPDSASKGTLTELTMYSDEPAILNFNGVSSDDFVTEMKIKISENSEYFYSAQDKDGNMVSDKIKISFFKDFIPVSDGNNNTDTNPSNTDWSDKDTSTLPKTGSIGFRTLIVLGSVLLCIGVAFILVSKKKNMK